MTPSAWQVRKHSPEKVTFEEGLEGGLEDREDASLTGGQVGERHSGLGSLRRPNQHDTRAILPLLWCVMRCGCVKERDNQEKERWS